MYREKNVRVSTESITPFMYRRIFNGMPFYIDLFTHLVEALIAFEYFICNTV